MSNHGFLVLLVSIIGLVSQARGAIRGVNLGGWLLTEPCAARRISPSIYSSGGLDEWSLCNELGKGDCLSTLKAHWDSFYTRDDFLAIKAAGLNALRIPIGYWAVDLLDYEPYVSGQYPYLIQAVNWAQEIGGISVLIDLHGAPGSQNGQDNSGLIGPVLFQTNTTNSDRTLRVLQNLTQEFSRDVYGIEILNEPRVTPGNFTMTELKSFYTAAASTMRAVLPDAFYGPSYWAEYTPEQASAASPAIGLTLDTHQYYAFSPLNDLPHNVILDSICNVSQLLKSISSGIPLTVVGEWSLETGNAPNSTSSAQNGQDTQEKRTWLRLLFEAQLAAYSPNAPDQPSIGWFFWAWKTEDDIDTWSYRHGIALGYIPSDVSNSSQLVFPILASGCVDSSFNYTAPSKAGVSAAERKEINRCFGLLALMSAVTWWNLGTIAKF
ncbi:MAG: exo-1,3-beta-glucanase [Tremellales sp. Tagirdzhanova-0007]|nr:MAG: exo-1,3-beta-glucanase [Tremellales sp. Tagirdzhanova-0007]